MNILARHTLAELIARYGMSLCDDPRRCEALLRDFCGQCRGEIKVLIDALKEGVTAELLSSPSGVPEAIPRGRLVQRLKDHLLLTEATALWVVESWAIALNVQEETKDEIAQVKPKTQTEFLPALTVLHSSTSLKQEPGTIEPSEKKEITPSSFPSNKGEFINSMLSRQEPKSKETHLWKMFSCVSAALAITFAGMSYSLQSEKTRLQFEKTRLQSERRQLEERMERLETSIANEVGSEPSSFLLRNDCSEPIEFALRYRNEAESWKTGWWSFDPNEEAYLASSDDKKIQLSSPIFYYFAESSNAEYIWQGEDQFTIFDRNLRMRLAVQFPNLGVYRLSLSCDNS